MPPAPTGPSPGSLTVPPLFGWEHILVALVLVTAAGVAGLLLLASGRAAGSRNEWQAGLGGRAAQRRERSAGVRPRGPPPRPPRGPGRAPRGGAARTSGRGIGPAPRRAVGHGRRGRPQHSEREGRAGRARTPASDPTSPWGSRLPRSRRVARHPAPHLGVDGDRRAQRAEDAR